MLVKIVLIILIFSCKEINGKDRVKIWRHDNDILNPKNREPNSVDNCEEGLVFSEINTAPIYLDKISTPAVTLPFEGEIVLLDGGFIELSEKGTACMKLRELDYHRFIQPKNWISDANSAVPDTEKLPCFDDTIVFKNGIHSAVDTTLISSTASVSGMKFGDKDMTDTEFKDFLTSDIGSLVFYDEIGVNSLRIERQECGDISGCVCQKSLGIACGKNEAKTPCLNPVRPHGFCNDICGAYIVMKEFSGFYIEKIRRDLKEIKDIETHVSKITTIHQSTVIQIVFTEKEYTGASMFEAEKYYKKLKSNEADYKYRRLEPLYSSGPLFIQGKTARTAVGIVFGTLILVAGVFGLIFYLHDKRPYIPLSFRFPKRFSLSSRPLSADFRARFDNRDDGSGIIYDGQSLAGSVISLDKAFDNPMFGKIPPGSSEAEEKGKLEKIEESTSSNPIYEVEDDPIHLPLVELGETDE